MAWKNNSSYHILFAHRKCLAICAVVAMANMQYGFDSSGVGGLQAMPGFLKVFGFEDPSSPLGYGINGTVQQLMTSLLTLGSFCSSLLAGPVSHYIGRRPALWVACALNAAACAVQITSTTPGSLYAGRILLGLANGFFITFSNIYTAEAAPAHVRGVTVALFAFWVNVGSIIGTVVDYYTQKRLDKLSYQIPLACLYIVPTLLAIALVFVPESPRWLLHHGKETQARKSLERLRGDDADQMSLEIEWTEMFRGVKEEQEMAKSVGFLDMFRGTDLRRTILCYCMTVSQSASGLWFIIGYNTYFYSIIGVTKSFQYSIMNTCLGFAGVSVGMIATWYILGRRSILMIGAAGSCLSLLAGAIGATVRPSSPDIVVAFTAIYFVFVNGCLQVASYLVATELVSSRLRAWTVGTASSVGCLFAWLTNFCTPYFINPTDMHWGGKYFYIWAGSSFLLLIFYFFCIPEMKGRTLEEINELFNARVPARAFSTYQCAIHEEIIHNMTAAKGHGIEVTEIEVAGSVGPVV